MPIRIIPNTCDHTGNDDLREVLKLQNQSVEISVVALLPVASDPVIDSVEQALLCHISARR